MNIKYDFTLFCIIDIVIRKEYKAIILDYYILYDSYVAWKITSIPPLTTDFLIYIHRIETKERKKIYKNFQEVN